MLTEGDFVSEDLIELSRAVETNQDVADRSGNIQETLTRLDNWGRELGVSVSFLVDPQATGPQTFLGVQSEATMFEDDRGCRLSYQFDVDRARDAEPTEVGLTDVEITEIEAPNIGEEAYWVRITGLTTDANPALSVVDQIVFRQGEVKGFLRADSQFLATAPRNSGEGQVLTWAQIMAGRAEDATGA